MPRVSADPDHPIMAPKDFVNGMKALDFDTAKLFKNYLQQMCPNGDPECRKEFARNYHNFLRHWLGAFNKRPEESRHLFIAAFTLMGTFILTIIIVSICKRGRMDPDTGGYLVVLAGLSIVCLILGLMALYNLVQINWFFRATPSVI